MRIDIRLVAIKAMAIAIIAQESCFPVMRIKRIAKIAVVS